MRLLKMVLAFTLITLFASNIYSEELREHFEKTYAFSPGGSLSLKNVNGRIEIRSWDKNQVKIEAEKVVRARSRREAEELMEEIRISVERLGNEIRVETELPRGWRGGWGLLDFIFGRKHPQIRVDYTLLVPERIDLNVKSTNGGINICEVAGQVRTRTTNGHIEILKIRGSVNARSTNGSVKVLEATGPVEAKTTNGRIKAEILELEEMEGVRLRTTNGSITLYLPPHIKADVEASTTNGSIHTDFPLEVRGRLTSKRIRGSINGGGGLIELHTTNGSIKILEL